METLARCPWCHVMLVPSADAEADLECRACDSLFVVRSEAAVLWERVHLEVAELVREGVRFQG